MKCKLCDTNELENVGSHIFTESVIRTALNQEGYTKRENKEIFFEVSANKIGLDFFGSGVLPEVIEEITGKPISEELINNNENSFIDRELICRDCERYFSYIESEFVDKIYSKIVLKAKTELINDSCNFIEYKDFRTLTLIFIIINVWRASASVKEDWKLQIEEEEYLKTFLLIIKEGNCINILSKANDNLDCIKSFHFIISYFIQESENLTENAVVIDPTCKPYFFLLNRLSFIFAFQKFTKEDLPKILPKSINDSLDCLIDSFEESNLKININTDSQRKELFNNFGMKVVDQVVRKLNYTFTELHRQFLGYFPTQSSIDYYATKMKLYVQEKKGKIDLAEMLKILAEILYNIRNSYK